MKELSIEEKAKAYNNVREKIAIRFGSNVAEEIFSEYEESEDERIMKWLIELVEEARKANPTNAEHNGMCSEAVAWLEKQGNNMGISKATKQKLEDSLKEALEKETAESFNAFLDEQGEQKQDVNIQINPSEYINDMGGNGCYLKNTAQKPAVVIPKFRVGDEIKTPKEESLTITKIDEKGYWSEDLFICGFDDEFRWGLVEQNPADKVETKFKVGDIIRLKDGDGLEWTVEEVLDNGCYTIVCADRDDFIQLDDKWELVDQKPTWSEEDEQYIIDTLSLLSFGCSSHSVGEVKDFLKSLKGRFTWKPSDDEMEALEGVINSLPHQKILYGLYQELKKLRGK